MAFLKVFNSDYQTDSNKKIRDFLKSEQIDFGHFDVNPNTANILLKDSPDDEERKALIQENSQYGALYENKEKFRCDLVCFYPDFEHLEFIINKFGAIHFHYETEYWYFVAGNANFGFLGQNGLKFQLTVGAGDFLQVPEGFWQWFTLTEDKYMKAIRYFYTEHVQVSEQKKALCDAVLS